ncbi:MAG: TIGR03618 family F420-dependent PPOX class oxidoreductase [Chloroflexi bacterium]|nr:TIGR03618 family F420-dependent PPOX class oxidoreductase [Chloroflexota bacterium]
MNESQIEAFLQAPHLSELATLLPDGSPHVTPVWHHYESGVLYVLAERGTVKIKNIQQDPRICITVASHQKPYAYVMARGRADLSKDRKAEILLDMSVRYMGDEAGKVYAESVKNADFLTITLKPEHLVAWSG